MISAIADLCTMQHVFDVWEEVSVKIRLSRHFLLLLDYDGTLTPIVERPEIATLSANMKLILKSLSQKKTATLGIISGRALMDLRSRVGLQNVIYAGNHGLEIEGPGIRFLHPVAQEIKATLKVLHIVLGKALMPIDGAFVEDKGLTLSVHFRQVKDREKEREVRNVFEKIVGVARMVGRIRTTTGKKVYEIRPPVSWDKGQAIKMLIKEYGKGIVMPLYAGDDLTDEDAFIALKDFPGISIYVGGDNPVSTAQYYLNTTSEVEELLIRIDKIL
jgi:trehalose 6-phosphate phosphatase